MDPNVVINRLVRLAKLDTTVFDEVRDDANELIPAIVITVVSALLAGLGALLFWSVVASGTPDRVFVNQVIFGTIFMAVMYGVAALVVYVVMVQMSPCRSRWRSPTRAGKRPWPMMRICATV